MRSSRGKLAPEFAALLNGICEERLTIEEKKRLAEIISANDDSLRDYVEVLHLWAGVIDWAHEDGNAAVLEGVLRDLLGQSDSPALALPGMSGESLLVPASLSVPSASKTFDVKRTAWVALAASLIGVSLLLSMLFTPSEKEVAKNSSKQENHSQLHSVAEPAQTSFVAHVVEATSDVVWADQAAPFDYMLRIGTGERVAIKSGVLRLEYFTGAEVILHGPAVFVPTGPASGHLASGRITGKVINAEKKDFRLSTPSAEVIDLGTVFGVAVGDSNDTDVCVFDGEVEVKSLMEGSNAKQPIRLLEGMSVRLTNSGHADLSAKIDREQFLSELPPPSNNQLAANEVSLIESFIDGPGLSYRLLATLDPTTGKTDEDPYRHFRHGGEAGYRLAVYSEFLDGVFIPNSEGRNVQLDSYGHTANLPRNTGQSIGTVWARRPVPGLTFETSLPDVGRSEIWEVGATPLAFSYLNRSRLGVIGLQSNVGISFDLRAIQSIEGQSFNLFRCELCNSGGPLADELMKKRGLSNRADVRFFVDGKERKVCFGVESGAEAQMVNLELDPFARVLTVVATNAEDNEGYDQILLIDPIIEMAY